MHPRRRPDLTFAEIEQTGESVLVDGRESRGTVLTPLAAVVWLLCDGERSVAAITEEICERYAGDVDRERVAADVRAAVDSFAREGLLEA
jgi:hypothetical protein